MKIIEDEVIGELRYLTVKFDQSELITGGVGVISQGAVRRYFEKKNPDLKVKKCGGLKLDYQEETVAMRFGVVNQKPSIPGGSKTLLEDFDRIKDAADGEAVPVSDKFSEMKFLNPGYDELKKKYNLSLDNFTILMDEKVRLQEKYDALVTAVSKDAQKFSDLLVENEELKVSLMMYMKTDMYAEMDEANLSPADKEAIRIGEDALQIPPIAEDAADLADAKEAIKSADSVPLSEESENV